MHAETSDGRQQSSVTIETWEINHNTNRPAQWEMLPPNDLKLFLSSSSLPLGDLHTILSTGCGRATRDLVALTELPQLNRPGLSYTGVENNSMAIAAARNWADLLRQSGLGGSADGPGEGIELEYLPPLQSHYEFIVDDVVRYLSHCQKFDLVIDWMCLHNINQGFLTTYVKLMKAACARFMVLQVFSREGSILGDLGYFDLNAKQNQFSEADLRKLLAPEFRLVDCEQYPESLEPDPMAEDGIVSAKRAYLFERVGPVDLP